MSKFLKFLFSLMLFSGYTLPKEGENKRAGKRDKWKQSTVYFREDSEGSPGAQLSEGPGGERAWPEQADRGLQEGSRNGTSSPACFILKKDSHLDSLMISLWKSHSQSSRWRHRNIKIYKRTNALLVHWLRLAHLCVTLIDVTSSCALILLGEW